MPVDGAMSDMMAACELDNEVRKSTTMPAFIRQIDALSRRHRTQQREEQPVVGSAEIGAEENDDASEDT